MSTQYKQPPRSDTSKTLILMRHAKSDWADKNLTDFDRPLNPRGRRDAPAIGQWLEDQSHVPDTILSSSAARTRQTVSAMTELWQSDPTVHWSDDLYLATPNAILEHIHCKGDDANCLMVVAHNPGISYLASMLSEQEIEMPTAALAIFQVPLANWNLLESSSTTSIQLVQTMKPKSL